MIEEKGTELQRPVSQQQVDQHIYDGTLRGKKQKEKEVEEYFYK